MQSLREEVRRCKGCAGKGRKEKQARGADQVGCSGDGGKKGGSRGRDGFRCSLQSVQGGGGTRDESVSRLRRVAGSEVVRAGVAHRCEGPCRPRERELLQRAWREERAHKSRKEQLTGVLRGTVLIARAGDNVPTRRGEGEKGSGGSKERDQLSRLRPGGASVGTRLARWGRGGFGTGRRETTSASRTVRKATRKWPSGCVGREGKQGEDSEGAFLWSLLPPLSTCAGQRTARPKP